MLNGCYSSTLKILRIDLWFVFYNAHRQFHPAYPVQIALVYLHYGIAKGSGFDIVSVALPRIVSKPQPVEMAADKRQMAVVGNASPTPAVK